MKKFLCLAVLAVIAIAYFAQESEARGRRHCRGGRVAVRSCRH